LPKRTALSVAEIGSYRGVNAMFLLARRPRLRLTMVDPWAATPHYSEKGGAIGREMADDADGIYREAMLRTEFAGGRRTVLRMTSLEAARWVPDGEFDMVFLDGDHTYKAVHKDLPAWLPKVKPGGLLCGHDFRNDPPTFGVRSAVLRFAALNGLEVKLAKRTSCWFIKV